MILGLLLTLGMVLLGIITQVTELSQLLYFIDPGSIMVVLGGSLGSTILSMPFQRFLQAGDILAVAFRPRKQELRAVMDALVAMSETARRDGVLALEPMIPQIRDPYLARGLQLAVDGTDLEAIESTLSSEISQLEARHESGRAFLELFARYAPAYGMLGTVIGLVLMLAPSEAHAQSAKDLGAQAHILRGMALALVTTFYGLLLANAVALPLADRLAEKTRAETLRMEIVLAGLHAIQSGDNPRVVAQKLRVFLPPTLRN